MHKSDEYDWLFSFREQEHEKRNRKVKRAYAQDHLKMLAHRQQHFFAINNDPSALREPDCCGRMVSKVG